VAVIGLGNQGFVQCEAIRQIPGVEIAGVADLNENRRSRAIERLGIDRSRVFRDAGEMLSRIGTVDLVSVATTAQFHVDLARASMQHSRRILIEKPLDTSLQKARALQRALMQSEHIVAVNYSRRWVLDFQAVRRCIQQGAIGDVRSIAVLIGKGEVAMHASHYFDLCRFLLQSDPAWIMSRLEPVRETNPRGRQYHDPAGFVLAQFRNGGRCYFDFSTDLARKAPSILIKGTLGTIAMDEQQLSWTLTAQSQRTWMIPFAEPMNLGLMVRRVVVQALSEPSPLSTFDDGLKALEMIYAAHLSSSAGGQIVHLPLADEQPDLGVCFP
jgi:predicted dehydrogenase